MKLTIGVNSLRTALSRALGVAGTKTGSMPILSTVLLTAEQTPEGGRLTARAYDLEIEVTTEHAAEVAAPGAVAVSAKLLADVAKALPAGPVTLTVVKQRLEVVSGASSFRLALLPAEDFPTSPAAPKALPWAPVDRHQLLAALDRVRYAASHDETRYNLNGVFFDHADDRLSLVATDGHRLATAAVLGVADYGLGRAGAIVSRKAVDELHKLLAEESADVADLAFAGGSLLYRRQGLRYVARLVDGQFPDWTQVVPKIDRAAPLCTIGRVALRDVLKRVLLLAADVASPVTLKLTADRLHLSARNPDAGDSSDELAVTYNGPAVDFCVNGRLLAELLGAETADALELQFGDEMAPLLWWPAAGESQHVLMPMRK